MVRASVVAFIGATALLTSVANAADLPMPPMPLPPIEDFGGGWYLRGDIGMTNQKVRRLENVLFPGTPDLATRDLNFQSGMLFGLGVGYQINPWFRVDVTGEYRGETGFHGLDTWTDPVTGPRFNNYTAKKSEWLFLANAYVDLGTWASFTPFVGAGIGGSYNTIHSFRDQGTTGIAGSPTLGYANAASKWNMAWALHAGVAYKVTPNVTLEFAYRYVNLGDGVTGDIITYDGVNAINNPMTFKGLSSHDLKFGVRWMLDAPPPPMPAMTLPPLMRRG